MAGIEEIIKGCLKGSRRDQELLYRKHSARLYAVCLQYSGNDDEAKDILQEGFIKVFKNLNNYRFEGDLGAWIRRIMVNTSLNYLKTNQKYNTSLFFTEEYLHPVSDQSPDLRLHAKAIADLVRQLPQGYQVIFNLYAIEGYSHVEIGEILGIAPATSRSQYSRARSLLISWIEQQEQQQKNVLYP